ncbi:FtsX-like permease family protein [Spiractinospora alimapuensis]|uniref:ABC transporter permease n=1 Tax=Spiractinospora alimapuensis TaxID=2820884 RepID=UPI001F26BC8E|nr:ABC transporter permease [Spiractinospora alimapuensis]QVQ50762.1 FtsX-like permease family protein [Spiractinospora alimapuensis]
MSTKESLDLRYTRNDLTKNRGVNIALVVILVLSAFLMATGAMMMERLVGSVDQLFEDARPPHFLQMHTGDYDPDALDRFAAEHPEIVAWHVEQMVGYDGAAIAWNRPAADASGDFSESLIDNLVVTPNPEFDLLLDGSGEAARPSSGEVYVPVAYERRFDLQVGDELTIGTASGGHALTIAGFVRDAQMASSMSSATRFVVAEEDFAALENAGGGAPEIIVGYRLTDQSLAGDFQRAYEADADLPKNGQAVTFQMIRVINAFSDGLVAVALVFVSALLVAIALLNLRFVIRGTLEDEVREIGAMKAIGLPNRAITRLYLAKYRIMTLLACVVGGVLAIGATQVLTRGIQVNYAAAPLGVTTFLVPVLSLVLVYLFVIGMCRGVLRGVRRIEVVGALVHGSTRTERQTARRARRQARRVTRTNLATFRGRNLSRRLALMDLRAEKGQWILIPLVFFLVTVLMTLPMNLLSTFESPRFVTYMGAADSDLRVDLRFSDDVDSVHDDVLSTMRADDRLENVRAFANVLYAVEGDEGPETLRVDVGDYSNDSVEYLRGGPPEAGEIALSLLNTEKHDVSVGDELTVLDGDDAITMAVSGTYQDVTSGGYTARTHGEVTAGAAGYVIYTDLAEGADPEAVAIEYGERFPTATVTPMREYVEQTLSHITGAFQNAALVAFVFGVGVALLITTLFLRLRLGRDRQRMGVLSALGFSTREIVTQLRGKTLLTVTAGTSLGLVFTATAGESLVGLGVAVAGLGIGDLTFIPNPWLVYVAYPLILVGVGYLGAVVTTRRLGRADKSAWLRG